MPCPHHGGPTWHEMYSVLSMKSGVKEPIKIKYDPEVDVLRITLKDVEIEESDEETPGIILDLDVHQNIVGIEILKASQVYSSSLTRL